jgi:alkylhydroperoxidase family enzyme
MSTLNNIEQMRSVEFDINAREAEIIGKPQRIQSLRVEELDDEAMTLIMKVRRSLDSMTADYVSDYFGLMLQHPGLFQCQMDTAFQLVGKGAISRRERELAILRVAWWCRAPYEWGEHVRIAKRYEITEEEIARVRKGSRAPGWSDHDRVILRGVEELLGDQMISDETWEILARSWDERQLIEFPFLVGQYFLIALQQNSLRVRLDRSNIGLHQS